MKGLLRALNAVCIGFTVVMLLLYSWGTYRSYNLEPAVKNDLITQCSISIGKTKLSDQYCSCIVNVIESEGLITSGNYDYAVDTKVIAWLQTPAGNLAMHKCMPEKDIFGGF